MAKGDKVRFNKGTAFTVKSGDKKNVDSFQEMQSLEADCSCGQNCCEGYETLINATTGERLIRYYTGALGGPYTEVVTDFATGLAAVKALYAAR